MKIATAAGILCLVSLVLLNSCSGSRSGGEAATAEKMTGEAEILQSWPGDFPVAELDRLPAAQSVGNMGCLNDEVTFKAVWEVFQPGLAAPEVDFEANLVFFVRNTQYFNRINVGLVNVTDGLAEIVAMETMSAAPIHDIVAMVLVEVPRRGIVGLKAGDDVVPVGR